MKYLFILNDPPYGTERSYNALRLARNLLAKDEGEVRIFLIGDAVACGKAGQKVPGGYYNIADMLSGALRHDGVVNVCGSCMDARAIGEADLVPGAKRGSMDILTEWTAWADKVLVF
jgi:uncharacterized protein involved in oxidation of intracellular sulfur